MHTWFSSDSHFGHENIIKYCNRPYADADEMSFDLIERWNRVVAPEDVVWYLGDFAMGRISDTLPLVELLNGHIILIPGNHDRCWNGHRKRGNWVQRYLNAGFAEVIDGPVLYDLSHSHKNSELVWLSHFPYTGDSRHEDRYSEHRPKDDGVHPIVHGHVHDLWQIDDSGRQINVGVDVWDYTPVHIDTIRELLAESR